MKKFKGSINGEIFNDVKKFTEQLKTLDWTKPYDIRSDYEYYEEHSNQSNEKSLDQPDQHKEPCKCSCCENKVETTPHQDKENINLNNIIDKGVITDEMLDKVSDDDIIRYGKIYKNKYNYLNQVIDHEKEYLRDLQHDLRILCDEIESINAKLSRLHEVRDETMNAIAKAEASIDKYSNERNAYSETGKLKLINKYNKYFQNDYNLYSDFINSFFF